MCCQHTVRQHTALLCPILIKCVQNCGNGRSAVRLKIFPIEQIFGRKQFRPKKSANNFIGRTNFRSKNVSAEKFSVNNFPAEKYFGQKIFRPKKFWPKNFPIEKLFGRNTLRVLAIHLKTSLTKADSFTKVDPFTKVYLKLYFKS